MKVMTRREQEGIGVTASMMYELLEANRSRPVNAIIDDMMIYISDITGHAGEKAKLTYLTLVHERDCLPGTAVGNANRQTGHDR